MGVSPPQNNIDIQNKIIVIYGRLTMPRRDVLVGNAGSDIEHDDTTLAVDIVTISQATKLFLSGSIPHIELDGPQVLFLAHLVR